ESSHLRISAMRSGASGSYLPAPDFCLLSRCGTADVLGGGTGVLDRPVLDKSSADLPRPDNVFTGLWYVPARPSAARSWRPVFAGWRGTMPRGMNAPCG